MERPVQAASFRDPSGFVFTGADGVLYRQVNRVYDGHYRALMDGGLYAELVGAGLMVEHEEVPLELRRTEEACRVLRPRRVPFVSYPYEWSFSQLQDAALITLDIQLRALARGLWLKDASAYNVQIEGARAVFIDTLSFETYREGRAWPAYGQFCRHFLATLALMARMDVRLGRLLALHLDGIPLDLAVKLLPWSTRLRPGLLLHLHLHAKSISRHADTGKPRAVAAPPSLSRTGLQGLLENLRGTVAGLSWAASGTEWAEYYASHSYSDAALEDKKRTVAGWLERIRPRSVWDLGANTGLFSRIASRQGAATVAFDVDPACVERNYLACRKEGEKNLLALLVDLSNPSPGLGWAHAERSPLAERGPADAVMALALIHHLAISHNVPLGRVAEFLARIGRQLVIEFVPKSDPQVQRLLRSREDVFAGYSREGFEAAFGERFRTVETRSSGDQARSLYWMEARS